MDTSERATGDAMPSKRSWRRHPDEFKARVVELARQPHTSMAAVALAHGLNANMLRRWVQQSEISRTQVAAAPAAHSGLSAFVPLRLAAEPEPSTACRPEIRIECQRQGVSVTVHWPVAAASECARMLRELLR
jgi:transposase